MRRPILSADCNSNQKEGFILDAIRWFYEAKRRGHQEAQTNLAKAMAKYEIHDIFESAGGLYMYVGHNPVAHVFLLTTVS